MQITLSLIEIINMHKFSNNIRRSFLCITGLVTSLVVTSCHVVPDQGPTSMNKIHQEQLDGKRYDDNYVIINITKDNIGHYNRRQYKRSGALPKAQSSKMYSDAIRQYDKLTLLVIDTAEQGAFANSKGPVTFGPIEVPASGKITIPYAGEFNVAGKSINTVQKEIKGKYSTVFNTAEVSLNRIARQPLRASVLGLARSPGQHEITRKGVTLAELVALSGGATEEPFLCDYLIHRNKKTYILNNDQITKMKLLAQDGDLIEVKRSAEHSITMMGSVRRPGNHKFPKSRCYLSDFIGSGSGMNLHNADATGIFVFRRVSNGRTHLYRFNMQNPEGLIYASKFDIHSRDLIYVTEAPLSKWGRVIKGISPFQSLSSMTSLAP